MSSITLVRSCCERDGKVETDENGRILSVVFSCISVNRYLCVMENLKIYNPDAESEQSLSSGVKVHAGFSSSAHGSLSPAIDLNRDLSLHQESTFYARVEGESMRDVGVGDGDILVVDKSLDLKPGDMAVCVVNGEFVVKFVEVFPDRILLTAAHPDFPPIEIHEGDAFELWGVVTYAIRKMRGWGRKSRS